MRVKNENLRNLAIIAHVDHGKTTVVDALLHQSGVFRDNEKVNEQVMDSNDLERERGITILSKNTAVAFEGLRINIVDTPGHADFGGEVERVLKMVDGVMLVVDAYDGPMPQTRFVLRKALDLGHKAIVMINKIDRPDARPLDVEDMVLELFIELGADDEQLEFPVLYASARDGYAARDVDAIMDDLDHAAKNHDFQPVFEAIRDTIPCPSGHRDAPLQMLVSNIDYDNYIGRLAIGRVERGFIRQGQNVALCSYDDQSQSKAKVAKLFRYEGLLRREVTEADFGEIVCLAGIPEIGIGDTVCDASHPEPLPFVSIDEPTIAMTFSVNDSPFAGREGQFVTSRQLRERLFREMERNVAMRLEETDTTESFVVKGRGELHLSILIETMRREGYEFQVSKPRVIIKEVEGQAMEPVELLIIDVPEAFTGVVIEKLGRRRAELVNMKPPEKGYARLEFSIPSRGLIGYRSEFLTDTKGNGIMNSVISGFEPLKGQIETRSQGVLVAWEDGEAMGYGLHHAQGRGSLIIGPGTKVYAGMIVGITTKNEDVTVNVCKRKQATNIRAAGSDDSLRLVPPLDMSLEQFLEFVSDDEQIEITPQNIRLRKRILNADQRMKQRSRS